MYLATYYFLVTGSLYKFSDISCICQSNRTCISSLISAQQTQVPDTSTRSVNKCTNSYYYHMSLLPLDMILYDGAAGNPRLSISLSRSSCSFPYLPLDGEPIFRFEAAILRLEGSSLIVAINKLCLLLCDLSGILPVFIPVESSSDVTDI